MEPVDYAHLLYVLRAAEPATITIPADKLTPGCVLATGPWDRHVVVALPTLLNSQAQRVAVRHVHGGHRIGRRMRRDEQVRVYATQLAAASVAAVPEVPRCFVPDDPQAGDVVFFQDHSPMRIGATRFYHFNGHAWTMVRTTQTLTGVRRDVQTYTRLRSTVANPEESSPYGFYTYQRAGHVPHLYVDGRPMPARLASDLAEGDMLRVPGGGRLRVEHVKRAADGGVQLNLCVAQRSSHDLRFMMLGSNVPGAVVEAFDSGMGGTLYPVEPRPSQLVSAEELRCGDTVIGCWDRLYSAVAEISSVMLSPLASAARVDGMAADGRPFSATGGLEPRHVLLHRAPAEHARADRRAEAALEHTLAGAPR